MLGKGQCVCMGGGGRVCVCVLYTIATTKLTLQIPHLKPIGSENVQDL